MTENEQDAPSEPDAQAAEQDHATAEAEDQERPDNPNREAARYRRQLREVEAERDQISATLGTYRRRDAEQIAETAGMASGADLFALGTDLTDLLDDSGAVDEAKVRDAAAAALTARPHWGRRVGLDLGVRGTPEQHRKADWQQVLKGR